MKARINNWGDILTGFSRQLGLGTRVTCALTLLILTVAVSLFSPPAPTAAAPLTASFGSALAVAAIPAYGNSVYGPCSCYVYIERYYNVYIPGIAAADMGPGLVANRFVQTNHPVTGSVIVFQRGAHGTNSTYGHVGRIGGVQDYGSFWRIHVIGANQWVGVPLPAENNCTGRTDWTIDVAKGDTSVAYYVPPHMNLGGVSLAAYCARYFGGNVVLLPPGTALNFNCEVWHTDYGITYSRRYGIDVSRACRDQVDPRSFASTPDWHNPWSWGCYLN